MKNVNIFSAEPKENPHGVDVRMLYNHPAAQAVMITLKPGESLKPHTTAVDVFFFVFEGQVTVHIGEESESFGPGTLIESPKDILHNLSNSSNEVCRTLVVKAPKP